MDEPVAARYLNRRLLGNKSRVGDSWLVIHFDSLYKHLLFSGAKMFKAGDVEIKKRNPQTHAADKQIIQAH
jgi:hypothetical protein